MIKRSIAALAIFWIIDRPAGLGAFRLMYFRAYGIGEGQITPAYLIAFGQTFPGLIDFDRATCVYQIYGRLYSLVIPLTIPALMVLKEWIGANTRFSRWGWRIFYGGVLIFGAGIFGDYWTDQNSFWVALGFLFELIGMFVLGVGSILNEEVMEWYCSSIATYSL